MNNLFLRALVFVSLVGGMVPVAQPAANDSGTLLYVGTYTGPRSKGIYSMRLDTKTGALTTPQLAAESLSPSFLALHPNQRFLYSVNEVSKVGEKPTGSVSAFTIDPATGRLTLLNSEESGGGGPCHLSLDSKGGHVFVANYGGGSIAAFPVGQDGRLSKASSFVQHAGASVNSTRQKEPHAHHIVSDPSNRYVLACDLGLDKVLVYKFDPAAGKLMPNEPPAARVAPGSGPRHLAFDLVGKYCYVINEILCTVTAFSFNRDNGTLQEIQTLTTLPGERERGFSTAEIVLHPSGKFLYGSNRGHDSIAVYAIDAASGKLSAVRNQNTGGKTPRNFNIDPTGNWLLAANQSSDTVVVFKIDPKTGSLTAAGQTANVPSPVCLTFVPGK